MPDRTPSEFVARMSALDLPQGAAAPDWVHLLPAAQGAIHTADNRGPYHVGDAEALIAASMAAGDLQIDENHAEDLASGKGGPSPARGWITELQARADGIWGRVEWTPTGAVLVAERAYRAMSPVFIHDEAKNVLRLLRASLVNRPNLRGLATLNQEQQMTFIERVTQALAMQAGATEDQLVERVTALQAAQPALQSQLAAIGTALGVTGGDAAAVLAAAQVAKAAKPAEITALQAELAAVTTSLNDLKAAGAREKAEAYVDGEIAKGRVGLKAVRDRYIALHQRDAAEAVALIGAMPILGPSGALATPPAGGGEVALNAEEMKLAEQMGEDPKELAKALAADRTKGGAQ